MVGSIFLILVVSGVISWLLGKFINWERVETVLETKLDKRKFKWFVIIIAFLFFTFYLGISLNFYYSYIGGYDIGMFANVLWNLSHGNGAKTDMLILTTNNTNFFGHHFSPILLFIAPLYRVFPKAELLLIIQSLFLIGSLWPIYYLLRYFKIPYLWGSMIVLGAAVFPGVQSAILYEFHPITFVPFFLLWVFYFLVKEKWSAFWISLLAIFLIKESIALLIAFFGIFIVIHFKERKRGWSLFLFSLGFFFLLTKVLMPWAAGESNPFFWMYGYNQFGSNSFIGILGVLFRDPGFLFTKILHPPWKFSVALLYIGLIAPFLLINKTVTGLLFYLPEFAKRYLATWQSLWLIGFFQYNVIFLPMSLIIIFSTLKKGSFLSHSKSTQKRWRKGVLFTTLTILLLLAGFQFPFPSRVTLSFSFGNLASPKTIAQNKELIKRIPDKTSLTTSVGTEPYLANRKHLSLPPVIGRSKYILYKYSHKKIYLPKMELGSFLSSSPAYKKIYKNEIGEIWKRIVPLTPELKRKVTEFCEKNWIPEDIYFGGAQGPPYNKKQCFN